jgi:hypothetical protein
MRDEWVSKSEDDNSKTSKSIEQSYYTSTGRKVGDFCIGFFGPQVVSFILSIPINLINLLMPFSFMIDNTGRILSIIFLLLVISVIVYGVIKRRKFLWIGAVLEIVISNIFTIVLLKLMMER